MAGRARGRVRRATEPTRRLQRLGAWARECEWISLAETEVARVGACGVGRRLFLVVLTRLVEASTMVLSKVVFENF